MPFNYTCELCGKPFTRKRRRKGKHFYCSRKCYHQATKTGHAFTCGYCDKEYYLPLGQSKTRGKFCSQECYFAHKANRVTKTCPACGDIFSVKASESHKYTVCSWKCRTKTTVTITCKRCGNPFTVPESSHARHHCSEKCRRPATVAACEECGKTFRHIPSRKRRFCSFRCYRAHQGETSIEKRVRESLDELKIQYSQEYAIGRYSVDFFIPALNIALEVDGTYWHRDEAKDRKKSKRLVSQGFLVRRIAEQEITNTADLTELLKSRLS